MSYDFTQHKLLETIATLQKIALGPSGITSPFDELSPSRGYVTKVLLTRSPLNYFIRRIDIISTSSKIIPFDLHALSTPPAFILDQDQILIKEPLTTTDIVGLNAEKFRRLSILFLLLSAAISE